MSTDGKGKLRVKCPDIEHDLFLGLDEIMIGGIKKMRIMRQEFIDHKQVLTELREKVLSVKITPGIPTGTRIRFPEEGDQGPAIFPADIIFIIREKPNRHFQRNEHHLCATVDISLEKALTGAEFEVRTIDGRSFLIQITDVISPTYVKVIKNEGLPIPGTDDEKGNLYIYFNSRYPSYIK